MSKVQPTLSHFHRIFLRLGVKNETRNKIAIAPNQKNISSRLGGNRNKIAIMPNQFKNWICVVKVVEKV